MGFGKRRDYPGAGEVDCAIQAGGLLRGEAAIDAVDRAWLERFSIEPLSVEERRRRRRLRLRLKQPFRYGKGENKCESGRNKNGLCHLVIVSPSDYFEEAIRKDPNYALAYTDLANSYLLLSAEEGPSKAAQAKAAALNAIEKDRDLAEAHAALSFIKWVGNADWAGAETHVRHALALNPNSADARYTYARLLADAGRFDDARAQAMTSIQLDPLSIQARKRVAYIQFLARRYDEAIAEYRKLIDVAPDFIPAQRELGLAYEQTGRYEEAQRQFLQVSAMPENYAPTMLRADLGHLYAVWGRRAEAQAVLTELLKKSEQTYVSAYDIAVIYAGLGDINQSLMWLDKAVEQRPFWLCWLKLDPRLDGLRAYPRFQALLRNLGQAT